MTCQRVQEAVGRGVVCRALPQPTQQGGNGGEQDEEIQIGVLESTMEGPATRHLGPQHLPERFLVQLGEQGTTHDTGGVKHPAHIRPAGGGQPVQDCLHGMLVGHVRLGDVDAGAPTLQLEHRSDPSGIGAAHRGRVPPLARRKPGAPHQYDVARATSDHPPGDLLPQVSQSTCHEVRRVAAELFGRRRLRGPGAAHETRRVPSATTKRQLRLPASFQDDCD